MVEGWGRERVGGGFFGVLGGGGMEGGKGKGKEGKGLGVGDAVFGCLVVMRDGMGLGWEGLGRVWDFVVCFLLDSGLETAD